MPGSIVQTYVDRAIANMRRLDRMRIPARLPEAMRDESIQPSKDWIGWKPVPSTVSDIDLPNPFRIGRSAGVVAGLLVRQDEGGQPIGV